MSISPAVTKNIIVGIGLVSSLTALLMIMQFIGLNPDYPKVFGISNQASINVYASVADALTGFFQVVVSKVASF